MDYQGIGMLTVNRRLYGHLRLRTYE